jgi:hypothetical protein
MSWTMAASTTMANTLILDRIFGKYCEILVGEIKSTGEFGFGHPKYFKGYL